MPMGGGGMAGMMPHGGQGGAGGGGQERSSRPKNLVVPRDPHTESVTGKVSEDRIATSATGPEPPEPPTPDGSSPTPRVRRVTIPPPRRPDEDP
jgi:hypothetical protein